MGLFYIHMGMKSDHHPKAIRKAVSEYFLSESKELEPYLPALRVKSYEGKKLRTQVKSHMENILLSKKALATMSA